MARYEAWKAGGRKGGRAHMLGFGSATPRHICQPNERPRRSSSHSCLHRRSPNGSEIESARPQRRAMSACSTVRRHWCAVDANRMGMCVMRVYVMCVHACMALMMQNKNAKYFCMYKKKKKKKNQRQPSQAKSKMH